MSQLWVNCSHRHPYDFDSVSVVSSLFFLDFAIKIPGLDLQMSGKNSVWKSVSFLKNVTFSIRFMRKGDTIS